MSDQQLTQIRTQIDQIDLQIQTLINQRAVCAQQVAQAKQQEYEAAQKKGEKIDLLFYRPEREAQVLRSVIARNQGPLDADAMARIFREIMSACLALEKPMQVAYFGPEGTYTHAAALKHFGHAVIGLPMATIAAVFAAVERSETSYGVVPVENSSEGMVTHTLDNFLDSPLHICGEVELPIHHHLLVGPTTNAQNITKICAHPQALAQCRLWLEKNWPNIPKVAVASNASNAEAARMARDEPGVAAVAGEMAADIYGLIKLAENIEDHADNTTRFLIIGREEVKVSGKDKTSIIVSTRNKPGALFCLLEPFHKEGVMLTRIDTRPSRTEKWAYVFFIEFEGHQENEPIKRILREIEENSLILKVLGSYPCAVL